MRATRTLMDFETGISELIRAISESKKPVLVLIAGMTRSGKTYFTEKCAEQIGTRKVQVSIVSLDNFFRDIHDPALPRDASGNYLFDVPDAYKGKEFWLALHHLLVGLSVNIPIYDLPKNRVSMTMRRIKPNPVIIAEGLFAISLAMNAGPHIIKVFMDTGLGICLRRRIERDTALYGVSSEDVRRIFEKRILPYYQRFILPQKEEADLIIRSA